MPEANRLHGADFLRAVACLAVMMHHLAFRVDMRQVPEVLLLPMRYLVLGSFGVSVFFVLSGFLLARPFWQALDAGKPMPSMRTYWLRRLARIAPGFWLALTASLLLYVWLGDGVLDAETIARYLAGFFLVSDFHYLTLFPVTNNGPLWSIGFEVTAYMLLPLCLGLLFTLGKGGWTARLVWLGVIGMVLVVHALIIAYAPIDDVNRGWDHGLVGGAKAWMPRYNPIGFFAIFAIGSLAAGIQVLIERRHIGFDIIGVLSLAAVAAIILSNVGGPSEGFGWLGIPYAFPLMPIAVGAALIALSASVRVGQILDNSVTRFIARISFGIYVWHFLILWLAGQLFESAFKTAGPEGFQNWLWSSAGVIVVSVIAGTLSFYLVEQPAVRWARRLEKRSVRAEPAIA